MAHFQKNTSRSFRLQHRAEAVSASTSANMTKSTSTYAEKIVNEVPKSSYIIGAVAGLVFIAIIAGSVLWKLRERKLKQKAAILETKRAIDQQVYALPWSEKGDLEKPKAVYSVDSSENNAGWTPQIKTFRGVPVSGKQLEENMNSPRSLAKWEKAVTAGTMRCVGPSSPPPMYSVPSPQKQVVDLPSYSNSSPSKQPIVLPPTPTSAQETSPRRSVAAKSLIVPPNIKAALPSPSRSSSFANQQSQYLSQIQKTKPTVEDDHDDEFDLPRLMKVQNIFNASLDDELPITAGETLLMMEEYHDGWCLVQRMVRNDSVQKGVVPRFCLVERPKPVQGGRSLTAVTRI